MKLIFEKWHKYLCEAKNKLVSSCIIINEDGEALVIKRSETANWKPLHWEFPGGIIDAGETPKEAAIREVKEESNLDVSQLQFLSKEIYQIDGKEKITKYYFVCDQFAGDVALLPNTETGISEHSDHKWVPAEQLFDLPDSAIDKSVVKKLKM